jgi:hypothetical protein
VLGSIDLDSGNRQLDDEYKLEKCVKIARLYLEDDDSVKAEAHIKKASFLLPKEPALASVEAKVLTLQYKVCFARIQDSKRRFLEAALRYYELSQVNERPASPLKPIETVGAGVGVGGKSTVGLLLLRRLQRGFGTGLGAVLYQKKLPSRV